MKLTHATPLAIERGRAFVRVWLTPNDRYCRSGQDLERDSGLRRLGGATRILTCSNGFSNKDIRTGIFRRDGFKRKRKRTSLWRKAIYPIFP